VPDDASAKRDEPGSDVHAPELLTFVEAVYPAAALDAAVEGTVVLRLSIDADGAVTNAEVMNPAGYGFDEAALTAALRFHFSPARKGEIRVPSRIAYEYEFHLPKAAAADAPTEPVTKAESPPPTPLATPEPVGLDVTVRGPSEVDERRRSAEAVTVIETEQVKRQTADLGEVLARTQGVGVRRAGGLGSDTRFSLGGLTDDQVRFFIDGVPLELAGFSFGVANVPVNLIERIEIHSGVVPIRLGADALGGAVNLITGKDVQGTHLAGSYEVGSFDTHRLTLDGRHLQRSSGLFTRVTGFFDSARNDYPMDVEVPDDQGRLSSARVYRFHDGYRAAGGNLEVGLVDRPFAKRLLLRGFVTASRREYQHNLAMTLPYGEATSRETIAGVTLRYQHSLGGRVTIDALLGYSASRDRFRDVSTCVYDWFGRCVRERSIAGETDSRPHDQLSWDKSGFARVNLGFHVLRGHTLRVSAAPSYLIRTGDERRQLDPTARDALNADRTLLTVVNGVEYQLDLLGDRLENILFIKQYVQGLNSEEPRPGGTIRKRDRNTHRVGAGDALRYRVFDWLSAKASYEWATRLPRPDEVFGDNNFVVANLDLEPEKSHNLNLGFSVEPPKTSAGALRGEANAFLREAEDLIVLLGGDRRQGYQNVFGARSQGVEAAAGWTSPREYVALDANVTYVDLRNRSAQGTFGDYEGDRIPNRPYLYANGAARVEFRDVVARRDEIALTWSARYTHSFYRGWESIGNPEFKQVTPAQLVHSLGLGYLVKNDRAEVSSTFEIQNLTDEPVFDFYGVQRPGRAFYLKTTAEF
jgi:TonB family protein